MDVRQLNKLKLQTPSSASSSNGYFQESTELPMPPLTQSSAAQSHAAQLTSPSGINLSGPSTAHEAAAAAGPPSASASASISGPAEIIASPVEGPMRNGVQGLSVSDAIPADEHVHPFKQPSEDSYEHIDLHEAQSEPPSRAAEHESRPAMQQGSEQDPAGNSSPSPLPATGPSSLQIEQQRESYHQQHHQQQQLHLHRHHPQQQPQSASHNQVASSSRPGRSQQTSSRHVSGLALACQLVRASVIELEDDRRWGPRANNSGR